MAKLDPAKMPVRVGDYLAVQTYHPSKVWVVRHAWVADVMSTHETKADAVAAAKRYAAGDKRRAAN